MTPIRTLIAGTAAATLIAAPVSAVAQSQDLPQELSGLNLTDVTETGSGDDREIRATLDGSMFEVEYENGQIEEIDAASGATLPQALLEATMPAEVLSRVSEMNITDITQAGFDDDGEIEIDGMDPDGPVEVTLSSNGQMMSFDRRD